MRCTMSFGNRRSSGSVTTKIRCYAHAHSAWELKEHVMRVSMLALALGMVCFAAPARGGGPCHRR